MVFGSFRAIGFSFQESNNLLSVLAASRFLESCYDRVIRLGVAGYDGKSKI